MEYKKYGPRVQICDDVHAEKHRGRGENFYESVCRFAGTLADNEVHRLALKEIGLNQRFLAAGRVQSAVGSIKDVTAFNCFVSGTIRDSMNSIFSVLHDAANTMRKGGGDGFDFSNIRPKGDRIVSLDSEASGPISFANVFNTMCATIKSAGHRRGAMMGVLRIDHPDIEEFIHCKKDEHTLTNFNLSIAITDEFMDCLENKKPFPLKFEGRVYKEVNPQHLWDEIMRNTWDWAEPGVLFIDTINRKNNLYYCETIAATNPCGEQPLPPNGACLLGSFNLSKYIIRFPETMNLGERPYEKYDNHKFGFDIKQLEKDIPHIVRAIDNVIDVSIFPLEAQKVEALSKRRMGLGVTGLANAMTALGIRYGSDEAVKFTEGVLGTIERVAYKASIDLAKEKGPFPLFDAEKYLAGEHIKKLPKSIRDGIKKYGIRNSHLTSIAPAGTISFTADNCSGGLEPVFAHTTDRTIIRESGTEVVRIKDYAYEYWGLKAETSDDLSTDDHMRILLAAAPYIDSAISKTTNIGDSVTFEEFKNVYIQAYKGGAKGCTTFRAAGKRFGILNKVEEEVEDGGACFIDPNTGQKECS